MNSTKYLIFRLLCRCRFLDIESLVDFILYPVKIFFTGWMRLYKKGAHHNRGRLFMRVNIISINFYHFLFINQFPLSTKYYYLIKSTGEI